MRLVYFAWVRQHVGVSQETVVPPAEVQTVGELMSWLAGRGEGHARAFADRHRIRAAVNQVHASPSTRVGGDDEVAFFPPVTGG